MIHLRSTVLCAAFLAAAARVGGAEADTLTPPDTLERLVLTGEMLAFADNMEYFNDLREGETILGSWAKLRLTYRPWSHTSFSLGGHIRKAFGDRSAFSDIRPLFRARHTRNGVSLIIGEIHARERHGLLEALLRREFRYDPAVEEGLQVLWEGERGSLDLWATVDTLHTKKRRENLRFGNRSVLRLGPVQLLLMAHADHHGGQLYNVPGPIKENITGALGAAYVLQRDSKLSLVSIEEYVLGSSTSPDRSVYDHEQGWGSVSKARVVVAGFDISALFFIGNDYTTWQGNPFYMSEDPYYYLQIRRIARLCPNARLDFGLRMDFVGIAPAEYVKLPEHRMWIELECELDRALGKWER